MALNLFTHWIISERGIAESLFRANRIVAKDNRGTEDNLNEHGSEKRKRFIKFISK